MASRIGTWFAYWDQISSGLHLGKADAVQHLPDRSHDFMTLLLHGELVVLPCAHLDPLLEQWLGDGNDAEAFKNYRLFLLDESHAHPAIPQLLDLNEGGAAAQSL